MVFSFCIIIQTNRWTTQSEWINILRCGLILAGEGENNYVSTILLQGPFQRESKQEIKYFLSSFNVYLFLTLYSPLYLIVMKFADFEIIIKCVKHVWYGTIKPLENKINCQNCFRCRKTPLYVTRFYVINLIFTRL